MKYLLAALIVFAFAPLSATAATSTLIINPGSALAENGFVSFTSTYPKAARKVALQNPSPVVRVSCSQSSTNVFEGSARIATDSKNSDGTWTGKTFLLLFQSYTWDPTLPADCAADLVSTTGSVTEVLATITFQTLPRTP